MSADHLARSYFATQSDEPFSGPIPRCVREPIREYEAHTSVIETFAAMLLIAAIAIAWGLFA
jgi:hypothetical protein